MRMVSVVVPAHDEEAVIGRLLSRLCSVTGGPEVVVVCNGCHDRTASVARSFAGVQVIETPVASKREALRLGNEACTHFPRVFVDADVEIAAADVLALARALDDPGVLAAAPCRVVPREGVSIPVRWWYDVWEQLPGVRRNLFGRGVIALSAAGHARVAQLPDLMNDDLAMSAAFSDGERRVVDAAVVVVRPPRVWRDLVQRRVRVSTGTAQAYAPGTGLRDDARTSARDLVALVRRRPLDAAKVAVFVVTWLVVRRRAARAVAAGDYTTWLRDESSRAG